ncbi:MYND-type domain-containing protein [Mycena chlorophos]|uniref:phytol kinase n=1 Tax=Mycena chlorophos TaxID=658473 RepID=A0A8H6SCU6_MYCCL|nr:MYND-type domain-containing protein [Mycena chlorophos]
MSSMAYPPLSATGIEAYSPTMLHISILTAIEGIRRPHSTKADIASGTVLLASQAPLTSKLLLLQALRKHVLEPTRVPVQINAQTIDAVERAWHVLQALSEQEKSILGELPDENSIIDIWNCVWSWLKLIDEHRTSLSFLPKGVKAEIVIDTILMSLLSDLTTLAEAHRSDLLRDPRMGLTAPAAIQRLIRAWRHAPSMQPLHRADDARWVIMIYFTKNQFSSSQMAIIRSAAGGSDEALAELGMRDFTLGLELLKSSQHVEKVIGSTFFGRLLLFFTHCEPRRDSIAIMDPHTFFASLCARRFIPILSEYLLLYSLGQQPAEIAERLVPGVHCAMLIAGLIFMTPAGTSLIPEAIEQGFLEALLRMHSDKTEPEIKIKPLLDDALPRALIRATVIQSIGKVLPRLRLVTQTASFRKSAIYGDWVVWEKIVEERNGLLKKYDAGRYPAKRMCDNATCSKVGLEAGFKRCSGCSWTVYCSAACQKADWTSGEHKQGCGLLKSLRLHQTKLGLTSLEHDFLRVLLDFESERQATEIASQLDSQAAQVLSGSALLAQPITMYDYSAGEGLSPVRILSVPDTVLYFGDGPAGATTAKIAGSDAAWQEIVRLARRSERKAAISVLVFKAGGDQRFVIVPRKVERGIPQMVKMMKAAERAHAQDLPRAEVLKLVQQVVQEHDEERGECVEFHQISL